MHSRTSTNHLRRSAKISALSPSAEISVNAGCPIQPENHRRKHHLPVISRDFGNESELFEMQALSERLAHLLQAALQELLRGPPPVLRPRTSFTTIAAGGTVATPRFLARMVRAVRVQAGGVTQKFFSVVD